MVKKKTKVEKIKKIFKLITDGKLDKALELADASDVEGLLEIGVLFGQKGDYTIAERIFNRIIQLTPNFSEAWYNKGVALGNLGKHDEAVKCYDEAIKINPNFSEAWSNKGVALGNLGKYDEAVKCYDEAIKINPNFSEAYGNKGISFLNRHKYDDARDELKVAKELFYKQGMKNDVDKAHELESLAKNASKLISELSPLDKAFLNSLKTQCLTELRENSLRISTSIQNVTREFEKSELPEDAIQLLTSKAICFTALSNALQFKKVNLDDLKRTSEIFDEWDLSTLAIAVESLTLFIRGLNKYSDLGEISKIPHEVEIYLLQLLKASYILDGQLTENITGKIRGEPYIAKSISARTEKDTEIKCISILVIGKDYLRICLVQLDFLITKEFPYRLREKDKTKEKIFNALTVARRENVDIICFPELSFAQEFVNELKKYDDIMIIGGSFYYENFNKCPVIINGVDYFVYKINPSPTLESEIAPFKGMKPGKDIKIFETEDGKFRFGVLICLDYLQESHRLYRYKNSKGKGVNFIFNPSYNETPERFQKFADTDCENFSIDVIQTNVKEYGGTCIIGVEHLDIIKRLTNEGYRPPDTIKYKLCEAIEEMMIIADLSMSGVQVPMPIKGKPRIKIVNRYIYENGDWLQK